MHRIWGYSGYAGSAKNACGLRFRCLDSPHFRDDRAFLMWVSSRILGNCSLFPSWLAVTDHPCKIPFCGSLGWGRPSSTALETGTIHSFLVSCQTPYHKATRTGFCFMDFTGLSVSTQSSGPSSYGLCGDMSRHQSKDPVPEYPYSQLVGCLWNVLLFPDI